MLPIAGRSPGAGLKVAKATNVPPMAIANAEHKETSPLETISTAETINLITQFLHGNDIT
jgi:hypothetical protein